MKNRVYYGEYSLKHWIHLVVTGDLILPEYQRSFVWEEPDALRFIKSLEKGQFVQPITIGCDFNQKNLILDGQQRLTSLILVLKGIFPDREKFESDGSFVPEDDGCLDEPEIERIQPIKWTFRELLDSNGFKMNLNRDQRYKPFDPGIEDIDFFLDKTFLGFSYIVPSFTKEIEFQHYYSELFRNLNYYGSKLSILESRRSLYFMDSRYRNVLDGIGGDNQKVLCNLKVSDGFHSYEIDFVKYLSVLSQFSMGTTVMVGYSAYGKRESFYADYVSYIMGIEQEERQNKFNGFDFEKTFNKDRWERNSKCLRDAVSIIELNYLKDPVFQSVVDADYWLFGLIYLYVFKGKTIKTDSLAPLAKRIKERVREKKTDLSYAKSPNKLWSIRERVFESVELFEEYEQD